MRRYLPHVSLVLAFALAGCQRDCYVIEITPDGDAFQRKLTCWHEGGASDGGQSGEDSNVSALPKEELARIGKLYQKRETPEDAAKQVFVGRFTGQTPADVGGAGSYTRFVSPLGATTLYVERFRGNDDLEARLARLRSQADRLVDLLRGWLESELGNEPNFDRLKEFVDGDLRRDLKNLGLYAWTGDAVSGYEPDSDGEFLLRMGHYLCERGYLTPGDIPGMARAVLTDDQRPLTKHVQRLVARKMGVGDDQPIPESLAFLSDPKRLEASWEKYVRTTDAFQQRLRQWKEEKKTNPDAKEPEPDDVLEELVGGTFLGLQWSDNADSLELKLHCGRKPFATNGQWDEKTAAVSWSAGLREQSSLPVLCFASWSCPDREFQEARFGKVVLSGEELGQYVVWYRSLSRPEVEQWDRLIAGCRPEADPKAILEAFRFSTDPRPDPAKPDERPASLADFPRQLIVGGLDSKEEEKQE